MDLDHGLQCFKALISLHQGFWQRQDVYREQPETHFKHELMVVLETEDPAQPIAWSTYPELNKIMTDSYRAPRVKVSKTGSWSCHNRNPILC